MHKLTEAMIREHMEQNTPTSHCKWSSYVNVTIQSGVKECNFKHYSSTALIEVTLNPGLNQTV
jgi:hypothetical protein